MIALSIPAIWNPMNEFELFFGQQSPPPKKDGKWTFWEKQFISVGINYVYYTLCCCICTTFLQSQGTLTVGSQMYFIQGQTWGTISAVSQYPDQSDTHDLVLEKKTFEHFLLKHQPINIINHLHCTNQPSSIQRGLEPFFSHPFSNTQSFTRVNGWPPPRPRGTGGMAAFDRYHAFRNFDGPPGLGGRNVRGSFQPFVWLVGWLVLVLVLVLLLLVLVLVLLLLPLLLLLWWWGWNSKTRTDGVGFGAHVSVCGMYGDSHPHIWKQNRLCQSVHLETEDHWLFTSFYSWHWIYVYVHTSRDKLKLIPIVDGRNLALVDMENIIFL